MGLMRGKQRGTGFDPLHCLCGGLSAYRLRREVQAKYGIVEDEDATMVAIGLCGCCSMIQDITELESRGDLQLFGVQPKGVTMNGPK